MDLILFFSCLCFTHTQKIPNSKKIVFTAWFSCACTNNLKCDTENYLSVVLCTDHNSDQIRFKKGFNTDKFPD